ncbi:MAG: pirin family protein [Candidatus Competibacteraceae bacterium]|nr:pirin family protein [Candidatus Competibacteraceae bacterium]
MSILRAAAERGRANHGWLDSAHSFSFSSYYDPQHMGFGPLRVINDDRIIPGAGFDTHGHQDMEIVSYVLEGALAHRDSLGTGSVIRPGDVQRMSAGTGIQHSEFNPSQTDPVHFLQIWIIPDRAGYPPSYEQKYFGAAEKRGRLCLVASCEGRAGSVTLHQDVDLYAALLDGEDVTEFDLREGRLAWIQVAQGEMCVNGQLLSEGDGLAIDESGWLRLEGAQTAEVLLFDMSARWKVA